MLRGGIRKQKEPRSAAAILPDLSRM
jgi:hypothetical protein